MRFLGWHVVRYTWGIQDRNYDNFESDLTNWGGPKKSLSQDGRQNFNEVGDRFHWCEKNRGELRSNPNNHDIQGVLEETIDVVVKSIFQSSPPKQTIKWT